MDIFVKCDEKDVENGWEDGEDEGVGVNEEEEEDDDDDDDDDDEEEEEEEEEEDVEDGWEVGEGEGVGVNEEEEDDADGWEVGEGEEEGVGEGGGAASDPGCNDAFNDAPWISCETQASDHVWMTSIKEKCLAQPTRIKVSSSKSSTSIHRVPHILFQQDKNAYVPHVVSIGPLHHHKRKDQLLAIEEHKWRYLNEIIRRKGEVWFKRCRAAVMKREKQARECYSQVIELDTNSFVEMMLLDGCFIIELFRKARAKKFEDDDPIFTLDWLHRELVIDLVMLENQIPFFILHELFDQKDIPGCSLKGAAFEFFLRWPFYRNILPKNERTGTSNLHIHHLLHLLHENIVPSTEKRYLQAFASNPPPKDSTEKQDPPSEKQDPPSKASTEKQDPPSKAPTEKQDPPSKVSTEKQDPPSKASKAVQCASKLQESGINFEKTKYKGGASNLLDIKFDKEKGIIEIPLILVGDETNAILRNLIAFEQCSLRCMKYITTYTFFMDCLIDSSKDVEILRQKKIIKTSLGSDEDVAVLFNKIHKEVIVFRKSIYLWDVCDEINCYCEKAWPRLRATLMRDYFKNPWAVISFIAALSLVLITMMQGFFSAFPKFAVGN